MSLLMEALRRAEQEQARNQEPPETATEPDSLLVLDLEETNSEPPQRPASSQETPTAAESAVESSLQDSGTAEPQAPVDGVAETEGFSTPLDAPAAPQPAPEAPPSEPSHEPAVDLRPGSRPDAMEKKAEPPPELTRALLAAQARARRGRWVLGGLAVLSVLILIGLLAWYELQDDSADGLFPAGVPLAAPVGAKAASEASPTKGEAVTASGGSEEAASPAPAADSVSPGSASVVEKPGLDSAESDAAPPLKTTGSASSRAEASAEGAGKTADAQGTKTSTDGPTQGSKAGQTASAPAHPKAPAPRTAREAYDQALEEHHGAGTIRIQRSRKRADSRSPALAAWEAYREGRYRDADRLYAQLLARRPHHRDALLGRAAVAVVEGRHDDAREFYLRLLERDPRDPLALAGMVSLKGGQAPVEAIARIRGLIADHPELGGLHFVLGNLYAQQSRWAYAQQAYFQAYAAEPGNPDYAFNLAVSLDHLGKPEQALRFYRKALELARARTAAFPKAAAERRVRELTESGVG